MDKLSFKEMRKKIKIVYGICDSRHKGIDGDTPIDSFNGNFYTTSDVIKLIKGKAENRSITK